MVSQLHESELYRIGCQHPSLSLIKMGASWRILVTGDGDKFASVIGAMPVTSELCAVISCRREDWLPHFTTLLDMSPIGSGAICSRDKLYYINDVAADWLTIFARGYVGKYFECYCGE